MSEWRKLPLKEITVKIGSGSTPTGGSGAYKETGVSLIRSQNVLDFSFTNNGLAFIDEEQAHALRNVIVEPQDVLLNITGDSVARCCSAPREWLPARVNQHVAIIRANPKHLDSLFLKYSLISIKDELLSLSEIGGTRNALTKSMLENLKLFVPSVIEQKAIASVLSSIDNKIDLLHRQNKTLESMAETLFRQWLDNEQQDNLKEGKLSDIISLKYGKALKQENRSGEGFPVVASGGIVGFHNEYLVNAPGIVIGRKGTLGKVYYMYENFYPIDTSYYIESKIKNSKLFYEYFLLKSLGFENMNSDSAVPGLNRDSAMSSSITLPSFEMIINFNSFCEGFFNKIKINSTQVNTLENLRDTLLPKLMSGELRVQYAEEAIASVA
ncbi:TPA: restriction endonuclease subunit S [Enterobacter ludwigii]|uniref:restriction endonuclease subunit S n=2 Tax=Enterobacteriaceae TaxID=543 RepID=UPI001B29C472|nr:restriction endonuclease subunit S [Escherichia coli]